MGNWNAVTWYPEIGILTSLVFCPTKNSIIQKTGIKSDFCDPRLLMISSTILYFLTIFIIQKVLYSMGFGSGIEAGSYAARWHRSFRGRNIPTDSLFAFLQSTGALGFPAYIRCIIFGAFICFLPYFSL